MLDRAHRLTGSRAFSDALRRGARARSDTVVVHLAPPVDDESDGNAADRPARLGLVVGKAVGRAVTRNHVKRRLRHLARERLASLPGGSMLVIRALPEASSASTVTLASDLDRALDRAVRRLSAQGGHR